MNSKKPSKLIPLNNNGVNSAMYSSKSISNLNDTKSIDFKNSYKPVYNASYLGSAILTSGKTGLGCLQDPLRELYCIYKERGSKLVQERRLIISLDGITMFYNEMGIDKVLHNDLSSVYDVMLLQFYCEKRSDKKVYLAFLPIDDQMEIRNKNLYTPLTKQYVTLLNAPHPYIITLIMRRSSGLQALECHVFILNDLTDAQIMITRIRYVCERYKNELNERADLFQYKPNTSQIYGAVYENQNKVRPNYSGLDTMNRENNVKKDRKSIFKRASKHHHQQQQQQQEKVSNEDERKRSKSVTSTRSTTKSIFDRFKFSFKTKTKDEKQIYDGYDESQTPNGTYKPIELDSNNTARAKSPTPSQFSIFNPKKNTSVTGVADVDFHKSKKLFDNGLLIDNTTPVVSRSTTPIPVKVKTLDTETKRSREKDSLKQKRSQSVLGSPIRTDSSRLRGLLDQRPMSSLSEQIVTKRSFDDEYDFDLVNAKEHSKFLQANHIAWNPIKKAPECLDTARFQRLARDRPKSAFEYKPTPIKPTLATHHHQQQNQASVYVNRTKDNYIDSYPNNHHYSPIEATKQYLTPTKDSAYNTNSSNEETEQDYYTLRSSYYEPTLQQQQQQHKLNSKYICGGVKVFPTLPKNNKQQQRYKSQVIIPTVSSPYNNHNDNYYYRENDVYDDEIIDLTSTNKRQMNSRMHTPFNMSQPYDVSTGYEYHNNREALYTHHHQHQQQQQPQYQQAQLGNYRATPTGRGNYTYHFDNDEHFGGY